MRRLLLLLFPVLLFGQGAPFKQFHNAAYKAGWDIHFSPYAGGEDLLFALRTVERSEGYLVALSPIYYSTAPSARFWRINELVLGWLPVNVLTVTAQHEFFGHGYRIRDIGRGTKVAGYHFETPPPYGPGGAATFYDTGPSLTTTEATSIAMAGVESTAILAQLTKFKWLETRFLDPRQAFLYLLSQNDLNLYIGTLDIEDIDLEGHDISMYVKSLNYTYTNHFLSKARLRSLSWINLADPFTYYSIYALANYILWGSEMYIPMIPIYKMGYLPTLRLGLTPFGPELFIENYLLNGTRPIYFYLVGGSHSDNRYGGAGFYAPSIWMVRRWLIGMRFDVWRQPKLLLNQGSIPLDDIDFDKKPNPNDPLYPYSEQHAMHIGAAGSFIFAYQGRSGFEMEIGYKSTGFLPGYSLRASPTLRLFYTLRF